MNWCQSYMLTFGRSVEAMNSAPILVTVTMVLSVCEADKWKKKRVRSLPLNFGFGHFHRANAIKVKSVLTNLWNITHSPSITWTILGQLDKWGMFNLSPKHWLFFWHLGRKNWINLPRVPLSSEEQFLWPPRNHDKCPSSKTCCLLAPGLRIEKLPKDWAKKFQAQVLEQLTPLESTLNLLIFAHPSAMLP